MFRNPKHRPRVSRSELALLGAIALAWALAALLLFPREEPACRLQEAKYEYQLVRADSWPSGLYGGLGDYTIVVQPGEAVRVETPNGRPTVFGGPEAGPAMVVKLYSPPGCKYQGLVEPLVSSK